MCKTETSKESCYDRVALFCSPHQHFWRPSTWALLWEPDIPVSARRALCVSRHHFHSFSSKSDVDSQNDPYNTPVNTFDKKVQPCRSTAQNSMGMRGNSLLCFNGEYFSPPLAEPCRISAGNSQLRKAISFFVRHNRKYSN